MRSKTCPRRSLGMLAGSDWLWALLASAQPYEHVAGLLQRLEPTRRVDCGVYKHQFRWGLTACGLGKITPHQAHSCQLIYTRHILTLVP